MSNWRAAAQQALEALEQYTAKELTVGQRYTNEGQGLLDAITALRQALAEPEQEMPSDTRYTVAVEGQALTYWDCIHDALTNAQRAVYAGVDSTTRAIDDLKAGRIAEWSYGFSAVRIYPPQSKAAPTPRRPLTDEQCDSILLALDEWASDLDHYSGLPLYSEELRGKAREVMRIAHGITGEQT